MILILVHEILRWMGKTVEKLDNECDEILRNRE